MGAGAKLEGSLIDSDSFQVSCRFPDLIKYTCQVPFCQVTCGEY